MAQEGNQKIVLVGLSGPSSSGKSTSAKAINSLFTNSILVHLDDFYLPDNEIPIHTNSGEQNWDCPEAIDFKKFKAHIAALKSGTKHEEIKSLEIEPTLNLDKKEIESLRQKIDKYITDDTTLILVDGFMLYHDEELVRLLDVKLFYHASYETLKKRREERAGYQTTEGFWVDPPHYFETIVWPEFVKGHQYLFENNDVNSELNDYSKNDLQISDYKNENGSSLFDLINWTVDAIIDQVYK